jgi:hypothetical protein
MLVFNLLSPDYVCGHDPLSKQFNNKWLKEISLALLDMAVDSLLELLTFMPAHQTYTMF